jgi:hypothetical protein
MNTITRRLLKLEQAFAPPASIADVWGSLASTRHAILGIAESTRQSSLAEVRTELDELGPIGLWQELVRKLLADRGLFQRSDESFAQTVARALKIDIDELVECIDQGRIGKAVADLFNEPCAGTDNGG